MPTHFRVQPRLWIYRHVLCGTKIDDSNCWHRLCPNQSANIELKMRKYRKTCDTAQKIWTNCKAIQCDTYDFNVGKSRHDEIFQHLTANATSANDKYFAVVDFLLKCWLKHAACYRCHIILPKNYIFAIRKWYAIQLQADSVSKRIYSMRFFGGFECEPVLSVRLQKQMKSANVRLYWTL